MSMALAEGAEAGGFEQYAGQVYGWAYRFLGRHHDALDVVQDVFLRWDRQCTRARPLQPRGWLRRVTLNRAMDVSRKRQADVNSLSPTKDTPTIVARELEEQDIAALRQDIVSALDRLSDIQRGVLVAKVYDELTFAEIATDMSLAVSTVKTHYLRAVQAVRDRLQARWDDEVQP